MGYYTQFTFTLEDGPEEQYNKMTKDIDEIMGCSDTSQYESVNAKWRSYEEDMERLSKKYPEITVRVNGNGDYPDDVWQDFWHNGKQFHEFAVFENYKNIKDRLQ